MTDKATETEAQAIVHHGDCLEVMRTMPDCSVDSIVTDPPYGLSFMGKKWDADVPSVEVWAECLRILKPGGHLLAFAGTRTQHRMATRIEDAGFEIRDVICWHYGSGFPKSHNISVAIDKAAGATREVVGIKDADKKPNGNFGIAVPHNDRVGVEITAPATDAARQWQGWGTALKPATEPITLCRKPLCGTIAANVQQWGTGGLNIDGCRVGNEGGTTRSEQAEYNAAGWRSGHDIISLNAGRWPANMVYTGECGFGDWQRYFYEAKASRADRDDGCESLPLRETGSLSGSNSGELNSNGQAPQGRNNHATIKPTNLMRYLCRLVTPPGGLVLDPFAGSGSTGRGAVLEGFRFVGIELSEEYCEIARCRIEAATGATADDTPSMFDGRTE